MTVIVFRDGILAADSGVFHGTCRVGSAVKVRKYDGWLYGACGDAGWDEDVERLIGQKFDAKWPEFPTDWECLIVSPQGLVCEISRTCKWEPATSPFRAIGAGAQVAIGALDHGATAEEAVVSACRNNVWCHLPVQSVSLG